MFIITYTSSFYSSSSSVEQTLRLLRLLLPRRRWTWPPLLVWGSLGEAGHVAVDGAVQGQEDKQRDDQVHEEVHPVDVNLEIKNNKD